VAADGGQDAGTKGQGMECRRCGLLHAGPLDGRSLASLVSLAAAICAGHQRVGLEMQIKVHGAAAAAAAAAAAVGDSDTISKEDSPADEPDLEGCVREFPARPRLREGWAMPRPRPHP
jgi:hypothetical protein